MASQPETNSVEGDAVASANRGKIAALAKSGFEASNLAVLLAAAVGTGVLGYFAYPLVNWGASSALPPPKPAVAATVNPDTLMAANSGAPGTVVTNPNPGALQATRLNNGLPVNAYGTQNQNPNAAGVQRSAAQPPGPSQAQILSTVVSFIKSLSTSLLIWAKILAEINRQKTKNSKLHFFIIYF